jgi:hypothetical protein
MSLRIVWACYPRNINVGIAAQIFVYVGTVILFIVNWFFTQRIVRAQHSRWGWSNPYRALHRVGLVSLIICLLMIIAASIQQFFTLNENTLRIDRNLQLTGQTYFAVFCLAPIVLVFISLVLPRRGTEKFGAGRLRNNIAILLFSVIVLSAGAIFRCATAWLPPDPLRNAQGQFTPTPWYYSKACFYIFNFTTEIIVVIFYAVTRVDLRFHIPNKSKGPGAYRAGRESKYSINLVGNEHNLKRMSSPHTLVEYKKSAMNNSSETLHEYEDANLFDDARTLADSLRYPSSVLEVDAKSGHWKIKRTSRSGSVHTRGSQMSDHSLGISDRETWKSSHEAIPPMPSMPQDWPLRKSQLPRNSVPVLEHKNYRKSGSGGVSGDRRSALKRQTLNGASMGNPVEGALGALEFNSEANQKRRSQGRETTNPDMPPPGYDEITPVDARPRSSLTVPRNTYRPGSDIRPKHVYKPSTDSSAPSTSAATTPGSDIPKKKRYYPGSESSASSPPQASSRRQSQYSGKRSVDTNEEAAAEAEFRRFSFEASPRAGEFSHREGSSESEREYERRHKSRSS